MDRKAAAQKIGHSLADLMETPEPYALTAQTALSLAHRIESGEVSAGYQTPAAPFGPDLALHFEDVRRWDV